MLLATGIAWETGNSPSEAPKRPLRELQDFFISIPTILPSSARIWACFWPRECFENKGFWDGPPMARATSGGQMQDCCTLCKGSGRFLFRAPQLSMEISCPVPMRISLVLCLAGKTGPHVCAKWRTVAHFARGTEAAFPECYDSSRKTAWVPKMLKILF